MTALLVVLGALAGAPLRLLAARLAVRAGRDAALGTLVVNVLGSAVLGMVTGLAGAPAAVVALVGTGFCGTLTTFSTLGADAVRLAGTGRLRSALAYAVVSVLLGVGAAAGAWWLAAR